MRGRFGFLGFIVVAILALLVGGFAYSWGLAAGQAQVAPAGTVAYPVAYAHPFGFGLFGFLFFLFVIGLVVSAFRGRRWAGGAGGPGGWGRGRGAGGWAGRIDPNDPNASHWMASDVPPAFQPMLEAWHRRAHGPASDGGPAAQKPGAQAPTGSSPFDRPANPGSAE